MKNFQERTNQAVKIKKEIFEKVGKNLEVQNLIGNYAQSLLSLLKLSSSESSIDFTEDDFKKGIKNLKDFRDDKISFKKIKKIKASLSLEVENKLKNN